MELVRVYDFETKMVSTIPAAELAPGMRLENVLGVGLVWVDRSKAKYVPGNYCRSSFSPDLKNLIRDKIMLPLAEVLPKTLEKWEDGFRRDFNAEQEIGLWVVIAERYTAFLKANALSKPQKQEVLKLMLHCTYVPNRETFWETVKFYELTRKQAEAVIAPFEKNWQTAAAEEMERQEFLKSMESEMGSEFFKLRAAINEAVVIFAKQQGDQGDGELVFGKHMPNALGISGDEKVRTLSIEYGDEEEKSLIYQMVDAVKCFTDR